MSSFAFDPAIADDANPAKSADNGRGVFFQLESNAMNGNTTFTASFYMRQLFDMKPNNLPVKQRVALHNETCHRLLYRPTLSIDSLLKAAENPLGSSIYLCDGRGNFCFSDMSSSGNLRFVSRLSAGLSCSVPAWTTCLTRLQHMECLTHFWAL